jgi:enoyl-CoA hydratase
VGELAHLEQHDGVAVITLDRPGRLNAIGSDMVAEMNGFLDAIEIDSAARAVVITGAGTAFCAGANIAELDTFTTPRQFAQFVKGLTDLYDRVESLPKPVIAAVNGLALGGGFELALSCDLRVAASGARLGLPEVKLGVMPAAGGTQRVSRMLPIGVAKELLMFGDPLDAARALHFGLVNAVVDDAVETAVAMATRLAASAPLALAAAKQLVGHGRELALAAAIVFERETCTELFSSDDRAEGIRAFLEKRPAQFRGR